MSGDIIEFNPFRNVVVVNEGVIIGGTPEAGIGEHEYFVTYYDEEGYSAGVWSGPTHAGAMNAAVMYIASGARLYDKTTEAI